MKAKMLDLNRRAPYCEAPGGAASIAGGRRNDPPPAMGERRRKPIRTARGAALSPTCAAHHFQHVTCNVRSQWGTKYLLEPRPLAAP